MRRFIESVLVLVITVITVFAMATIKPEDSMFTSGTLEEETVEDGKPEGTGYIFDDFGKGINIPVENIEKKTSFIDKTTFIDDSPRVSLSFKKYMAMYRETRMPPPPYIEFEMPIYTKPSQEEKNKAIVDKASEKMSVEDKLYLLKLTKNFKFDDIGIIKKAIYDGSTDEENQKIWGILKERLSNDEYRRLVEIVNKYEQ